MFGRIMLRWLCLCLFSVQATAATIVIQNNDDPGEGFNDPDPPANAAQKGNNPGSTLGEMRLNVFQSAADVWGEILSSNVTITVGAQFNELACAESSGTLGSAGATSTVANFPGGDANTAYPIALAEALASTNFNGGSAEINANFNSLVDSDENCLGGNGFYYGLDGNVPVGMANLYSTVLHELGHGLGFASYTDVAPEGSGDFIGAGGFPDTFSRNLRDLETGKSWPDMSNAERKASVLNEPDLVWNGARVTADRGMHLGAAAELRINAPGAIVGTHEALLGDEPTIIVPGAGVTSALVDGNNFGDGCSQINEASFSGKIILFDATESCSASFPAFFSEFATGAVGVIIAATTDSGLPDMSGQISNQQVTIPYVGVSKAVGEALRANIASANVTIRFSASQLRGENQGKLKMHAPAEFAPGASGSHWSKSAAPDLLMEPQIGSLAHAEVDLTAAAFEDIGWFLSGSEPGLTINAGMNDAWVSSGAPFQGFFFTVYPDLGLFFLSWFTFDSILPAGNVTAEFGAADTRWATGAGFYSGDSVTVSVELTTGGVFNGSEPTATQQKNYGTITITFNNCNQATLTYNFPSLGLSGQMTLTRVLTDNVALCQSLMNSSAATQSKSTSTSSQAAGSAMALPPITSAPDSSAAFQINAGLNDAWVIAGAPFQGLFFTVYPDLGLFFLSWFTFDSLPPDASVTATFGGADQRWVTGAGFYSGNSVTVSVELTSGGIFNGSVPSASQQPAYGTITITFISCNEATLSYNFPSVGLSGEVTLTRVVTDNVALCEQMDGV